jgi:hypothetical protein
MDKNTTPTTNNNAPKSQVTPHRNWRTRAVHVHPRDLKDDEFIHCITNATNPRAFAALNR